MENHNKNMLFLMVEITGPKTRHSKLMNHCNLSFRSNADNILIFQQNSGLTQENSGKQ